MSQNETLGGVGKSFLKRTLTVLALVTLTLLLLVGAWQVQSVVFLLFLGVLLAGFWRGLSRPLTRVTRLPGAWAVGVAVVALGALSGLLGWALAPPLLEQGRQLAQAVPRALGELERVLERAPAEADATLGDLGELPEVQGEAMLDMMLPRLTDFAEEVVGQVFGTVAATAGVVTNLVFLFFSALFFALNPDFYRRGVVRLLPQGRRKRLDEVLQESGETLWSWLLGRLVAMLSVGVMVTLGLWALGVPLALLLGVLAFLLDFVPYVGPFVAAVPALLLALTVSPLTVLWVAVLYLVVQQLESYLITPIVQQRAIELPPVLTLVAVFVFGGLFGFWGLLVATPLMAVILVFIRRLYLEDVLGDAPDEESSAKRPILVRRRGA